MAVTMQSGSPHLGRVPLMVIASENVIKILGRERDPVTTSRGLVVEDVNQLLEKIVLTGRNVKREIWKTGKRVAIWRPEGGKMIIMQAGNGRDMAKNVKPVSQLRLNKHKP